MIDYLEYVCKSNVMVPMRDGVKLATDIYLPAKAKEFVGGRFPAILVRTPYDKTRLGDHASIVRLREYALHGYVVVAQDCRGRHRSEGEFYPFVNETNDGHDTLEWIGEQPWFNGKAGTIGTSYNAQTQSSLATTAAPFLTSQYVSEGYSNYHNTRTRTNGAFNLHRFEWFLRMAVESHEANADPSLKAAIQDMRENLYEVLRDSFPIRRGQTPLARVPSYERALFDFMTRGTKSEYWNDPGLNLEPHFDAYKDVPITWLGGWYDGYSLDTIRNYEAMVARKKSPQYLIMGPWAHGMAAEAKTFAGQVSFGEHAGFASFEERLAWLDHTLKGLDNGVAERAPVRLFVMGGGSGRILSGPRYDHLIPGTIDHGGYWRDENEWPLARTVKTPHYFHASGELSADLPGDDRPATTYDFDPATPVPSLAGPGKGWTESGGPFLRAGISFHQRDHRRNQHGLNGLPASTRKDIVVFQTPPLSEDVELTGVIEVNLYISSSAVDTDFTAMLIDQYPSTMDYPEGYALNLCFSMQRCRFRESYNDEVFMEPGKVYPVNFVIPPTSNLFKKGHTIRIDISSSNWPEWEVNPNTGDPLGMHRRTIKATNSIYHCEKYPSHVVLPVISQE
ncbi:CocE/NonD family hydrolase [Pelagibius sp.]|uniref:CocE/NonD family hydrolase n=1 Tax=Pelagibius sp. TaxID=1931238 RepID=UPI003BB13527